jgi:predicted nucleic acid-binding protein
MSVLADTSVWIEALRRGERGRAPDLAEALDRRAVVMCGVVAAELLSGTRANAAGLWSRLAGLRWVDDARDDWRRAGLARAASAARGRPVALADALVAVMAARGDHELWTLDADFGALAEVVDGLRVRVLA